MSACSRLQDVLALAEKIVPAVRLDANVLDFLYANSRCAPMPRDEWEHEVRLATAFEFVVRPVLYTAPPQWVATVLDREAQSAIRNRLSARTGALTLLFHGGFSSLRWMLFFWLFPNGGEISLRNGYVLENAASVLFAAREAILAGQPTLMAPDGRIGREKMSIRVLGAQSAVGDGAPFLAQATGCPVVWLAGERTADGKGFTLRAIDGPVAEPDEPFKHYRDRFYRFYAEQLEAAFTGEPRNLPLVPYWTLPFAEMLQRALLAMG